MMKERRPKLQVEFGPINENNLQQLRKLNLAIFPVKYNDKFYSDILFVPENFAQYAYVNGFVVGAICARIEESEGGSLKAYIMTLGVLAAYRGRGIGHLLLKRLMEAVEEHGGLEEVYLHMQTSNADALRFYERHGFDNIDTIRNYYKRIEPPDCYILKKRLSTNGNLLNNVELEIKKEESEDEAS
mmetsp:Transcript_28645/g.37541  ORF Transcript_28645/g.37541 Transcript_28645/m.37541 type:complete len:186 (+) Transcript_28645:78-635(+)|eukprot:CAMPEP_0117777194 /NCGR_PEP_ID=MMETSP0948-20121206/241_1 /TAXON_ID=44440 /ORGANISM="Chattonella subsalsa, Strain CCMP2191" /LENGTH=185 /DNA_ID=CAMNT_0005604259 /DNA_START=56 /DNA_END=613 /DNA_ORIENTATION=+